MLLKNNNLAARSEQQSATNLLKTLNKHMVLVPAVADASVGSNI